MYVFQIFSISANHVIELQCKQKYDSLQVGTYSTVVQ